VLSRVASEVKVIHRRVKLRACMFLQEKALENPKISFVWNSTIREILGKNMVEGVKLHNVVSGKESVLECDGVFVAIGHKPNTEIFKDQIELDPTGYVVVREQTRTNIEGVFAAGDVVDPRYRQAIAAAGSGCKAAIDAEKYLIGQ